MIGPGRAWAVYVLRCGDGTLYTGATSDLDRRLAQHRAGRGARYTRSRLPVKLAYWERARDRGAALRREAALTRLPRVEKLRLVRRRRAAAPPAGPRCTARHSRATNPAGG